LNDTERLLVEECKIHEGQAFLSPEHPSTSCATQYGQKFIDAATDLYLHYKGVGIAHPQYRMSSVFRENGIRTCRQSIMDVTKVEYLINTHIKRNIIQRKNSAKT
jgi:hypothetical protein